jgi:hypothetical protein
MPTVWVPATAFTESGGVADESEGAVLPEESGGAPEVTGVPPSGGACAVIAMAPPEAGLLSGRTVAAAV